MRIGKLFVSLTMTSLLSVSCGGSGDDESKDPAASEETTSTERTSSGSVQASSVTELGLTGALAINLPDALKDTSASLALTAGQKSMEACLMKQSANQLVTQITFATSMLCHIEAEGDNIPWNTPVILDISEIEAASLRLKAGSDGLALQEGFPEGELPEIGEGAPGEGAPGEGAPGEGAPGEAPGGDQDFGPKLLGIYADETDGDNVSVYICEGDTEDSMVLTQSFKITGSKAIEGSDENASKGEINIAIDDDNFGAFKGSFKYDTKYSNADTSALSIEVKIKNDFFKAAQRFAVTEKDSGLIKVALADLGAMTFDGQEFKMKTTGVGLFDADYGNVFFSYSGDQGDTFATHACVDKESSLVDCEDAKFKEGGDLYLTAADTPKVLPKDYDPTAPEGFDCSTATWTKVSPSTDAATLAKHDKCDEELMKAAESDMDSMGSCFDSQDFAQSGSEADIDFEEAPPGEFEPDFDVGPGEDVPPPALR